MTPIAPPARDVRPIRVEGAIRVAASAVYGIAIVLGVSCLVATYHPLPLLDHWETVAEYQHFLSHGIDWGRIFAFHNEHRIVPSKLLNLADYRFFRGAGIFLIAVSTVLSCATIYLMFRFSGAARLGFRGVPALLFHVAAGTSVAQIVNLAWPFQTCWYFALLFVILATRSYQLAGEGLAAAAGTAWLFVAWALAAAATFSLAAGPLAWPVLIATGFLMRHRWCVQVATLVVSAAVIALYVRGYPASPAEHPWVGQAFRDPPALLGFALYYATNAVQGIGRVPQLIVGTALLSLVVAELLRTVANRGRVDPDRVFPLGVGLFVLGGIAITAVGRVALGGAIYGNMPRYVTYGLFLLLAGILLAAWRAALSPVALHGTLGVLVATMSWSGFTGSAYREVRDVEHMKVEAVLCEAAQACPKEKLFVLYPDMRLIRERLAFLKDHQLAHFALGMASEPPAPALVALSEPAKLPDCVGHVDGVDRTRDGRVQLRGWMTWPGRERDRPEWVSIYSPGGEWLGGGGVCEARVDVQRRLGVRPASTFRDYGFKAWMLPGSGSGSVYAVGFFGGDRTCKLASPGP